MGISVAVGFFLLLGLAFVAGKVGKMNCYNNTVEVRERPGWDERWEVDVFEDGHQKVKLFTDKDDAMKYAGRECDRLLAAGKLPCAPVKES